MTDEPTCTTDCARLAFLATLFCSGCSAGFDPLDNHGEPSKGPHPAPISLAYWAWSNPDKAGAPKDYGDPNDPAAASEAVPYVDPFFEGNVDPVEPDELATAVLSTIANDMRWALRDPVGPPGTEDEAPSNWPPGTGEEERNPLP
jgi:hypothetical protein